MGRFWAASADGLFGGFQRKAAGGGGGGFDPNQEFMPDTGWDNAGAWTPSGTCDVNTTVPSALHIGFRGASVTGTAAATLVPGTYRYTDTVANIGTGFGANISLNLGIGGIAGSGNAVAGNGPISIDLVVATVATQIISIGVANQASRNLYDLTGGSLKRIA